jgi:integrase/recombinase XerC
MEFPEAVRSFDAHMEARRLSGSTRRTYRYELVYFWSSWAFEHCPDVLLATTGDLEAYIVWLPAHGSKRGDATRALKAFYRWAVQYTGHDAAAELVIGRTRLDRAPDLPDAELRALLRAAFRRERRRGWAILLCVSTGARVGSLCALEIRDVDLERAVIHFRSTKGDRPYRLPLNRPGLRAARALLELRNVSKREANLEVVGVGPARFRQWVHDAEHEAGLPRVWPHLLRHAFSNRVALSGDVEAWRRAMNHADISQWARYNSADDERIRRAVSGAHP